MPRSSSSGSRRATSAHCQGDLRITVRASPSSWMATPMTAMLSRAAESIGLHWRPPPSPERSRLDDWFLGAQAERRQPPPVLFFPEVHEEVTRSWRAPFSARNRPSASSVLTTLDGGAAQVYVEIPPVEHAIAMQLCPQGAAAWRGNPRLPSRACKFSSALTAKAYRAAGQAASALHARMAVHETQSPHSRPPLLLPVGSRVRSEDAMSPPAPPAQPWSQVSVAPRTQSPLRDALPSELGPCAPPSCPTAGTSVAPLVPLVRSLGAWLMLPRPSRWLLRTIRLGYAIQFTRHPPKFRGVRFTSVFNKNAPVLRAEVTVLLAKDAIKPVPPAEMKSGFYSPYFIVPKKGGGL